MTHNAEVLAWAAEHCYTPAGIISGAALHGNMDILEKAYELGYRMTSAAITKAAVMGRLDMLRWLRERGCPVDDDALRCAAATGRADVVDWLLNNRN